MSEGQTFDVEVNGINYRVSATTCGSNDHFEVIAQLGPHLSIVVTDSFGECNPLRSLWSDYHYQSVHGAARTAMEQKCIRDAVESEIELHKAFCFEQIEEDLAGLEAEAHKLAAEQREREVIRERNEQWNRVVQAANARKDAEAAHAVAERLSIDGQYVVFDGEPFQWERTSAGTIKIERALNDAARNSGLHGQAVGEFYSLAQKMVAAAIPA